MLTTETASGLLHPQYVVEVVIHAWDAANQRNDSLAVRMMRAHPVHPNEDDKAYCCCNTCIREFTLTELMAYATKTVVIVTLMNVQ